jgi:hypothetical protein
MHFAFEASALILLAEIWWPRKLISVQKRDVFFGEQNRLAFHSASTLQSSLTTVFCKCSTSRCEGIWMGTCGM